MHRLHSTSPCAVVAALVLCAPSMAAQDGCTSRLTAELFTGSAWSLPTPLTVQVPEGTSTLRARYETRPFEDAPYYSYRVGVARPDGGGVEIEMLHHKLYLQNPSPPVDRLESTHGYNLPMVNAVAPLRDVQLRVGVGAVVAHPEGTIAGREISGLRTILGGGYHIAGVSTQIAVGRRYVIGRGRLALTAAPEAKLTASWARIGLQRGSISMPNVAVHLLAGVGARRC